MAGPCHIGAMRRDDGADDEARAGGRRARPARPHDANSGLGAEAGGGLRAPPAGGGGQPGAESAAPRDVGWVAPKIGPGATPRPPTPIPLRVRPIPEPPPP